MRYFGSNNVEGVAESWVEGEMSWMEVEGAGQMWVHSLVIPAYNPGHINWVRVKKTC